MDKNSPCIIRFCLTYRRSHSSDSDDSKRSRSRSRDRERRHRDRRRYLAGKYRFLSSNFLFFLEVRAENIDEAEVEKEIKG